MVSGLERAQVRCCAEVCAVVGEAWQWPEAQWGQQVVVWQMGLRLEILVGVSVQPWLDRWCGVMLRQHQRRQWWSREGSADGAVMAEWEWWSEDADWQLVDLGWWEQAWVCVPAGKDGSTVRWSVRKWKARR